MNRLKRFLQRQWAGLIGTFYLPVWIIEGAEAKSAAPLSLAYAGVEKHKNYLLHSVFGVHFNEKSLGKIWIGDISRKVRQSGGVSPSVIVREMGTRQNRFFKPVGNFRIPVWVETEFKLVEPLEVIEKKPDFRKIRSRIRSQQTTHSFSSDKALFDEFYKSMYVSYTAQSHKDSAFIYDYDFLKKEFEEGEILFVEKDDVRIGGILIHYSKNEAKLRSFGVLNGSEEYLQIGTLGILIYLAILRIKEKGYSAAQLGYSRGYLLDGALRFKTRMGISVKATHHRESGFLSYEFLRYDEPVKNFLAAHPFIDAEKGSRAVVFIADAGVLKAENAAEFVKNRFCRGLEGMTLYSFSAEDAPGKIALPGGVFAEADLVPAFSLFASAVCGKEKNA